jgi:hypothetical protein
MSAEEPETEAGTANDATEVVDDDFSTRLRNVAGSQAETQFGEAWSDEDDAADDAESESHPWSVVTRPRRCAAIGRGRGGGDYRRGGVDDASQGSTGRFPRSGEKYLICGSTSATATDRDGSLTRFAVTRANLST